MTTLKKLQTLQNKITNRIIELQKISQEKWGVSPEMRVMYDLDSVKTLGTANYYKGTMRLNKHLLLEFGDVYIDEVVVHEYAHFVTDAIAKEKMTRYQAHGREFKQICSKFGIVGKATTNKFSDSKYLKDKKDKLKANKKVFYYGCDCNYYKELSTTIHNRIQRGRASYNCRACKVTLKFVKQRSKLIA